MKPLVPLLILAAAVPVCSAETSSLRLLETTVQSRVGFDSNPDGTGGASAALLGDEDTLTYAAGAGFSAGWTAGSPADPAAKFSYAGEAVRFDRWSDENYSTHRFGLSGQFSAGAWKFTGDGSSLFVAGSRDTLASISSVNSNGMTLWRERRRQWQHRLKLQGEAVYGQTLVRVGAKLLAYDYQTDVEAGKVAFADRSDAQVSADVGWKQSARSLWLAGVRFGHQEQATVPLPGGNFEYSNDYVRLAVGWEGKLFDNTTVTFAAGPDFRHYSGEINPAVFSDRDRTSLWFETGLVSKITDTVTVSGKATRMAWLASTGKSAYYDNCAEVVTSWATTSTLTLQVSAKVHESDYYPTERDDWESIFGVGAAYKISRRTTLTLDVLQHHAWNDIDALPDRKFNRVIVNAGVSVKF